MNPLFRLRNRFGRWTGRVVLAMAAGTSGRRWSLTEPLSFEAAGDHGRRLVSLLPGLASDGASVPRLVWFVLGPPIGDRVTPAALIHDGLYAAQPLTRSEADEVFYRAMRSLGVGPVRAWLYWAGVRIGGWWSWRGRDTAQARAFVVVSG